MQGGFDSRLQAFNRATQAERQPGSTIKPIVYSAALENGMTPASIIVDGPFCVYQGARLGQKCFKNFGNEGGAGPHTMRWGIEQIAQPDDGARRRDSIGMTARRRADQAHADRRPIRPTCPMRWARGRRRSRRMVNAYAVLANQGRWHPPSLIDFVQDRHGKVIWPEQLARLRRLQRARLERQGDAAPRYPRGRQVVDAMTAYQMVHITEGVIQRGTATVLRDLDRPMFGKTGTNSGPTDVWFIGGTPQMIGRPVHGL